MGSSSKVVLVGATSLIIGIYGASLKRVQSEHMQVAMSNVYRVQRQYAGDAAMRSALSSYQAVDGDHSVWGTKSLPSNTGTFDYSIIRIGYSTTARVTVDVHYADGSSQTLTGTVAKIATGKGAKQGIRKVHKGRFEVSGMFAAAVKKPNKK
jgi:hypothetical protein